MWNYGDCNYGYNSAINAPAYSSIINCQFNNESIEEPVSLTDAKNWLRIDLTETTFDAQITMAITAARQAVEEYLNSSLIKRTVTVAMNLAAGYAVLPYQPVISLISATDSNGKAIDTSDYQLNGSQLQLTGWYNQVVLVYDAGYDLTDDTVVFPPVFKQGILRLIAFDWENRGDAVVVRKIGDITGLKAYRRVV